MRKKDKLIKEAFQVYQTGNSTDEEMDDFYSEGFEDKIFYKIEKMNIRNPRKKAKLIYTALIAGCLLLVAVGVFCYYRGHTNIRTTERIEKLWKEACDAGETGGIRTRYLYPKDDTDTGKNRLATQYRMAVLTQEQSNELEKYKIDCKKEDVVVKGNAAEMGAFDNMGMLEDDREVYCLADRKSKKYLIIKDNEEGTTAIAKFNGVGKSETIENQVTVKDVLENIYDIKTVDDIRSVTLERYQAKSKDEPEKLVAMYTKEEQKEIFLSYFQKENLLKIISTDNYEEESEEEEGREASSEGKSNATEEESNGLEEGISSGTQQKDWREITTEFPENCYLLAFENKDKENYLMGVFTDGECVQVYSDLEFANYEEQIHSIELTQDTENWLCELIQQADRKDG